MDAATWLKQLNEQSGQPDRRARLSELLAAVAAVGSLDSLLFETTERVSAFFDAVSTSVFMSDAQGQLRAVAWVNDGVRELRLPRDPSNVIGFAYTAKAPVSFQNLADPVELARLHPRLKPDDRLDRWLGMTIRGAIVVPLPVRDLPFGVMLVANRKDQSGLFVPRDLVYAADVGRAVANVLAGLLSPSASPAGTTPAPGGVRPSAPISRAGTATPATATGRKGLSTPAPRANPVKEAAEARAAGKWDRLIAAGSLSAESLVKMLSLAEQAEEDPAHYLIDKAGVNRSDVEATLSEYYNAPFYRFDAGTVIPDDLRMRLRIEYLKKMTAAPVERQGHQLIVVIDDPSDFTRCDALRAIEPDREVVFHVGFKDEILHCIESSYGKRPDVNLLLKELTGEENSGAVTVDEAEDDGEGEEADSAIQVLVSMIEPTLVAVLCIVIGGILLSVMLPLLSILTAIG